MAGHEMSYDEFVQEVCKQGLLSVKSEYAEGSDRLTGAVDGFVHCLKQPRDPAALASKLAHAQQLTKSAYGSDTYERCRWRELQVEWVCNVVSAMLVNERQVPIINPTARGTMQAHRILGGVIADG